MLKQRKIVAVVDDEPSMLRAMERLLNVRGFTTRVFTSAEAFLDGNAMDEASCLVLDIHLGGMSGIDLRRRLTAAGSALPIIFITAVDDETTHREAIAAGCVAYLHKPFPAHLLIGAIDKAMGRLQADGK